MSVRLWHGDCVADIALRGAELRAWRVGATPLIWAADPGVWSETAPILFPVVGWTRGGRMRVDGRTYPLGLHGFARSMHFALSRQTSDCAELTLSASAETRALYPFDFTLTVTFRLSAAALSVDLQIRNDGDGVMPYACGLHPGFCWPFAGGCLDDYAIVFAEPEEATVPVITTGGLFERARRPVPLAGTVLPLSAELFAREALCFLGARSRTLRFAHKGGAVIALNLEGFPHIALWSRPAGRFLSIEAWTGYGDEADGDGDLRTKPSMIHLAPGDRRRHAAVYRAEL